MSGRNLKHYSNEDINRIKEIISEGVVVMGEIADLKAGLSDTVKEVGKEIDVKPAQINKAISICYKNSLAEEQDKLDEVIDLIQAAGRG